MLLAQTGVQIQMKDFLLIACQRGSMLVLVPGWTPKPLLNSSFTWEESLIEERELAWQFD